MKKLILLVLLFIGFVNNSIGQILSQDFESATYPPTGWTTVVTNSGFTWARNTTTPITGTADLAIAYDPAPAAQDESLISPVFSFGAAASAFLSFDFSMSYYWSVTPNNNDDLKFYISTDGGATWTQVWEEADYGVFSNFVKTSVVVNLTAYVGNTNCKLKVTYTGNDGAQAKVDNILISTCPTPTNVFSSAPTATTCSVNYTTSGNVDIEYGPVGFTQGTGTTVTSSASPKILTGLTLNSNYDYYVRTNCGGSQSPWTGPFVAYTYAACPYSSGFDNSAQLAGWTISGNSTTNMGLGSTAGFFQSPSQYWIFVSSVTPAAANNNWLYCRPMSLTAGEVVSPSFWYRSSLARNLRLTVGNLNSATSQTTVVYSNVTLPISSAAYTQIMTPTFTAPTTGVYYFAFNDLSASTAAASNLRIDTINFTSVLATDKFDSNMFSVSPNPTTGLINISNNEGITVNEITVTDLNGRVVKNSKFDNVSNIQVNIGDLSAGIYMMSIKSDAGIATKKVVKE